MKCIIFLLLFSSSFTAAQRRGGGSHHSSSGIHHYSSSTYHSHGSTRTPRSHATISSGTSHKHSSSSKTSVSKNSTHHRDAAYSTNRNVPTATKNRLFKQAGIPKSERKNYVIDHKVALENGGTNDISNLQIQTKQAAKEKDKVENKEAAARRHSQGLTKTKHKKH